VSNRAAVLIDLGFFAKVLKHCFGEPRIDFEKFSDILCGEQPRLRTYIYDCMPYQGNPPTEEERRRYANHNRFLDALRKLNRFEVRLGRLSYDPNSGKYTQKRVDVLISVDLVRMSWGGQISTAVLVTGDSDLVPAVQAAKDAGVLTVLYHATCHDTYGNVRTRAHDELLGACDEWHEISEDLIESVRQS